MKQHGQKPNRQSILKNNLMNLIIEGGFNIPPPEIPNEEVTHTEPQVRPKHEEKQIRYTMFSGKEIRGCKTSADLDD